MKKVIKKMAMVVTLVMFCCIFSFPVSATDISDGANMENEKIIIKVVREDESTGSQPRIDKTYAIRMYDKSKFYEVAKDTPWLNENVKVLVVSLSSNVDSVNIMFGAKFYPDMYYNLSADDEISYDANAGGGYVVKVQVASGNVSETNPGTATIQVRDK